MKPVLPLLFSIALFPLALTAEAQVTQLSDNTNLQSAITLGSIAVLISDDGDLWRTDGTPAGTVNYTTKATVNDQSFYIPFANKIFFGGTAGGDTELWVTDGTDAGTQLISNIHPTGSSIPEDFMVYNNALYFFADDGTNGKELWKSDGTGGGTALLKDINPGAGSSLSVFTTYFIHNGILYFTANNGTNGTELWRTDGTGPGTVMVADINPGAGSSDPSGFVEYGSIVLFVADNGTEGDELWKTNGTGPGTELVKDINTGPVGSSAAGFFLFNNKLYFDAFDLTNGFEGWVTDGTSAGTVLLKDINPDIQSGFPFFINSLVLNNRMYFPATNDTEGSELWWSDGTAANTVLFKDINTGEEGSDPIFLLNFFNATDVNSFHSTLFKGIMFLVATTEGGGTELWKTDGTDAGTVRVKDINPGTGSGIVSNFSYFYTADHLYFSATDGASGNELWRSDGTEPNTVRVFDINPGAGSSDPSFLAYFNGIVLFNATDGDSPTDIDLFRLDGTFNPMPLHLLNFTATVHGKVVQLNWLTVSEVNTSHFETERSTDGARFEMIGRTEAAGNSSDRKQYLYNDLQAMSLPGNKLFYRLKMIDRDGKYTYSNVVAIKKLRDERLFAYPNPAKSDLTLVINSAKKQQVMLKIVDESGKQVYNRQAAAVQGNNSYQINVSGFARGTYYINVVTDEGIETTKFVRN